MPDRLYRSRRERIIGGVAGGIAESLRIDPTIVRVVWVLLAFATQGVLVLVYFVLLFIVPEAPDDAGAPGDATAAGPGASGAVGTSPAAVRSPSVSRARSSEPSTDGRTGALVVGAIFVLVGAYFLVRQYLPSIDLGLGWPFIAVGLGVVLLIASLRPGGRSG